MSLIDTVGVASTDSSVLNGNYQQKVFLRSGNYYIFWPENESGQMYFFYRFASTIDGLSSATRRDTGITSLSTSASRVLGYHFDVNYESTYDRVGIYFHEYRNDGTRWGRFVILTFNGDGTLSKKTEHFGVGTNYDNKAFQAVYNDNKSQWYSYAFSNQTYWIGYSDNATPTANGDWNQHTWDTGANLDDEHIEGRLAEYRSGALFIYESASGALMSKEVTTTGISSTIYSTGVTVSGNAATSILSQGSNAYYDGSDVHLAVVGDDNNLYHLTYDGTGWTNETISSNHTINIINPTFSDVGGTYYVWCSSYSGSDTKQLTRFNNSGGTWTNDTAVLIDDAASVYSDIRGTPTAPETSPTQPFVAWVDEYASLSNRIYMNIGLLISANFSGTPLYGKNILQVDFTDLSTPAATAWVWSFGDGNTASIQNPTNYYANTGSYDVYLTATINGILYGEQKVAYISVTASGNTLTIYNGDNPGIYDVNTIGTNYLKIDQTFNISTAPRNFEDFVISNQLTSQTWS